MGIFDSLYRLVGGFTKNGAFRRTAGTLPATSPIDPLRNQFSITAQYQTMWEMYESNGLYERLSDILHRQGLWRESLQPLRNPAHRIVEFHASKMWPGASLDEALPLEGPGADVQKAITQVWTWSNLAARKQVFARWMAAYGDLFIKVVGEVDPVPKVYFQLIKPEYCTQLLHDTRGYLIHLRIDQPMTRETIAGVEEDYWYTEIWNKQSDSMVVYEHDQGPLAKERDMGAPVDRASISERFGINFIPIAQGQFKDVGSDRGNGSFTHAFDKINEANRVATRLHSMAFRHSNVTMAFSAGGLDANMRPLPAPEIDFDDGVSNRQNDLQDGTVMMGDDRVLKLPGNSKVEFLVANLPYDSLLAVLNAQMSELEDDCPEMAYYRLRDFGSQLSGRAVRILLSDAIDRGVEARGNGEAMLIALDKMALTIGQQIGAFPGLSGSYESGTWDHSFTKREFIPESDIEEAQASLTEAQAGLAWSQLGVSNRQILREKGYNEAEIAQMESEKSKELQDAASLAIDQFNKGQVNDNPPAAAAG